MVITACSIHSRGWLFGNSFARIPELTTSGHSTSRTVQTCALVNHGGFQLQAAINWSCNFLRTPAICYTVDWQPFTSLWIYSHPTACRFWFLPRPVLRTIFKCAFWVISLEATLAASLWTNWCLRSGCVPMSDVFDVAPSNRLESDSLSPCWGGCVSMICWCGRGEEDDNGKRWEFLRTI